MQIGNLPVSISPHHSASSRQAQRDPGRAESGSIRPSPPPTPAKAQLLVKKPDAQDGLLGERIFNPAFQRGASHSGQYAVNTYRSVAHSADPELLGRLDVTA